MQFRPILENGHSQEQALYSIHADLARPVARSHRDRLGNDSRVRGAWMLAASRTLRGSGEVGADRRRRRFSPAGSNSPLNCAPVSV